MKVIKYPKKEDWSEILKRPTQTVNDIEATVNQIFEDVQRNGDAAISKYTSMFDGVKLDSTIVSNEEIQIANNAVSGDLKAAIKLAKSNIESFHRVQKTDKVYQETMSGVECWQEKIYKCCLSWEPKYWKDFTI